MASPEAQSLGKYGDIPVSLHTGVPDISIPLYNIQLPGLQIPITMSYHAGGIKVEEVAGNVGLGWTLNYGGMITQMQNGINDFIGYKGWLGGSMNVDSISGKIGYTYVVSTQNPDGTIPGVTPDLVFASEAAFGMADSQPDLFTYNFPGESGKFYFNQKGKAFLIPKKNTKVSFRKDTNEATDFTLTDDNGNQYIYANVSKTETAPGPSQGCAGFGPSHPVFEGWLQYYQLPSYSYSYYLSKIITRNNDTVTYKYETAAGNYTNQWTERRVALPDGAFYAAPPCKGINYVHMNYCRITEISSTKGHIVRFLYSTSERKDLSGDRALNKVEVYYGSQLLKRYLFSYDYFSSGNVLSPPANDSADYYRLKLTSVQEEGVPSYKFRYNESIRIPHRLSSGQDHWGYYNGRDDNNTLLPKNAESGFSDGANRDISPVFSQTGMLNEIIYPTGGKTIFTYEQNDCKIEGKIRVTQSDGSRRLISIPGETVTGTFTIPAGAYRIMARWNAPTVSGEEYVRMTDPTGSTRNYTEKSKTEGETQLNVPPGTYTVEIKMNADNAGDPYYLTFSWYTTKEVDTVYNQQVGGLRIKNITNYEDTITGKIASSKSYLYKSFERPQFSSGLPMNPPKYEYLTKYVKYADELSLTTLTVNDNITQVTGSVAPIGTFPGGTTTYNNVQVMDDTTGKNGYTRYYFNNSSFTKGFNQYPFTPFLYRDWKNGQLKTSAMAKFSNNNFVVQTKENKEYFNEDTDESSNVLGLSIGITYITRVGGGGYPDINNPTDGTYEINFSVLPYYFNTGKSWLLKEEKVIFPDNSTSDSLVTTTKYFYNNSRHDNPVRVESSTSTGVNITKYKYPLDYDTTAIVGANAKGITALARKNISNEPIEVYQLVKKNGSLDSLVTHGIFKYYHPQFPYVDSVQYLNILMPVAQFAGSDIVNGQLVKSPLYKTEVNGMRYDEKYNVLEQYFKSGTQKEAFIWDYNKAFPVAKVDNAGYADIGYTSFEAESTGNWSFAGIPLTDASSPTGSKCYNIQSGAISKSTNNTKTYILSYWTKNAIPFAVAGTQSGYPIKGRSYNGWTCYEHRISGVSEVKISGTGMIDELRVYPADASMKTFTYNPLIGLSATCDEKNQIGYYIYDQQGRLVLIKDQDGNVLKKIDYQYQAGVGQ